MILNMVKAVSGGGGFPTPQILKGDFTPASDTNVITIDISSIKDKTILGIYIENVYLSNDYSNTYISRVEAPFYAVGRVHEAIAIKALGRARYTISNYSSADIDVSIDYASGIYTLTVAQSRNFKAGTTYDYAVYYRENYGNLVDIYALVDGYVRNDGSVETVNWMKATDYIPIGGLCVWTKNTINSASNARGIAFYDSNKQFLYFESQLEDNGDIARCYHAPHGASYFRASITPAYINDAFVSEYKLGVAS